MFTWLANRLFRYSSDKVVLESAVRVLVDQLGGVAVLTIEDLTNSAERTVTIDYNPEPVGIRIVVRDIDA